MVGRVDELRARRAYAPTGARTHAGPLTGKQRLLFVLALLTFTLASSYASIALLTRVTPALFPGKELDIPFFKGALESLPGPASVEAPGPGSVFNQRINLLIIGVDKRPDQEDERATGQDDAAAYNTDTLMVATIDPVSNAISLLSFPRDLYIDITLPGRRPYKDRINSSYAMGILNEGGTIDAGAKQLMGDMKRNFGIDLDYWVWMDFKGVQGIIDAIGGVDLDVPEDLSFYDWPYTDDDKTNLTYVSFPPGLNKNVDGYHAVAFGRNRDALDGDLTRIRRQQLVVTTAVRTVFEKGLLNASPVKLWDTYTKYVHHNVPLGLWPGYVGLLKDSAGNIQTYSVGDPVNGLDTVFGVMTDDGKSVLEYSEERVQYWIAQAFTKTSYANAVVEIENASSDGDAAADALGHYLKFVKYLPTVNLGPDLPVQTGSQIRVYSPQRMPMAQDIAQWLGVPTSSVTVETRTSESQPDILIVMGEDFQLPAS